MSRRRHLVIFVKAPQLGAVKTRLATHIGRVAARRFYLDTCAGLFARLAGDRRWTTWLWVTPDRFARQGRFWPGRLRRRPQGRGDLGRRMARPFRDLPPGPVVLVGSDIPAIRRDHISTAFQALGRADAVFGPARDGGYWLVGFRRNLGLEHAFDGVSWSTDRALSDTLARLDGRRRVLLLETLEDVDDIDAFRRQSRLGDRSR